MRIDVHGSPSGLRKVFESALQLQCNELAIALDLVDGNSPLQAADPAVAVLFPSAGFAWTAADADSFSHLANVDYPVLPVIADAPEAKLLPSALARFNAFQTAIWSTAWSDGLVDEVLSLGWQHRRERRVFVSYRRSDSAPVARQLYDELTRRGYLTFLDDISIPKGVDFQRELKWWLNDADVVLVLITPNFENSGWCMEEINFAQSSIVGLLGVEWPGSVSGDAPTRAFPLATPPPPGSHPAKSVAAGIDADQRLRLDDADFTGTASDPLCEQELTDAGLAKVLAYCARQRALAIRLRLENLLPLAEKVLKPKGRLQAVGTPGDFTFLDDAGDDYFVRILPFRPDARSVHGTYLDAGNQRHIGCLYGESDANDPRAAAMRWLAQGRRDSAQSPRQTRIWTCLGDKVIT